MEDNNITANGDGIIFTSTSTGTIGLMDVLSGDLTIDSFEFKETSDGNFIEVIKRQGPNPNVTLLNWPPTEPSDKVWKEIYGITSKEDGTLELQLIKTINATVTPAHHVEEDIQFEE